MKRISIAFLGILLLTFGALWVFPNINWLQITGAGRFRNSARIPKSWVQGVDDEELYKDLLDN